MIHHWANHINVLSAEALFTYFAASQKGKKAMDKRLLATNTKIKIKIVSVKNFLH